MQTDTLMDQKIRGNTSTRRPSGSEDFLAELKINFTKRYCQARRVAPNSRKKFNTGSVPYFLFPYFPFSELAFSFSLTPQIVTFSLLFALAMGFVSLPGRVQPSSPAARSVTAMIHSPQCSRPTVMV